MLKIAENLSLPVDTVTQALGVLAKRRAGKSYCARRIVEQLYRAKQQIVIVDPKGDWWGIRSSADGKAPGLAVPIVGGEHGDIKLEVSAGEVVAKLAVEESVSLLLDLSTFRKHEVATFMTAFLETLYRLKSRDQYRTAMMLMIDEADAIAPQKPQHGEERMLGAAEDIVRRGGQRGIGCTMVTQRSAVLNKNLLTQIQILIAMRTIAPQDMAAMKAWIDVHGTDEQRAILMESLPSLPTGDAWVWSPGWPTEEGIFKRVHVLPLETFDSGATPRPGERRIEAKTLADVDLKAFEQRMAATIERTKADDPKELRKQIAELKKQLSVKADCGIDHEEVDRRIQAVDQRVDALVQKTRREYQAILENYRQTISSACLSMEGGLEKLAKLLVEPVVVSSQPKAGVAQKVEHRPFKPTVARSIRSASTNGNGLNQHLPIGERKILTALIQYNRPVSRESLTVLTGYKRSSRDAYIQRLREKGYVESLGGNLVSPTEIGIAALPDIEPLPTGEALQEWHMARLPIGERVILNELIRAYPKSISRDDLTESTEYKRSSRDAYLQRLTARMLVVREGGGIKASDELFD